MKANSITLEPICEEHIAQVSELLVYGFHGKFHHLTKLKNEDLIRWYFMVMPCS